MIKILEKISSLNFDMYLLLAPMHSIKTNSI